MVQLDFKNRLNWVIAGLVAFFVLFAVWLRLLPSAGMYTPGGPATSADLLRHLVMPTLVLSTFSLPQVTLFTRASVLETLRQDYVRTARAKGLDARRVLFRHALRNALIPAVTVMGINMGILLGGSAVIETMFVLPGVGQLVITALYNRDLPVIQGLILYISVLYVLINLAVDLMYTYMDPRLRLG